MNASRTHKANSLVTPSSRGERRLARVVSATFLTCSLLYILSWFLDYESNVIIFFANVFAPAVLTLLLCVTVLAEGYALLSGKRPLLRDRVVRYAMIASVLLPTIMGDRYHSPLTPQDEVTPGGLPLSVLDVNLLGSAAIKDGFYETLERLDPDVVTLQELNPFVAQRITERVGGRYQCQMLQPKVGVFGMGVLSRYPCSRDERTKSLEGIGAPQIISLQLPNTRRLSIVNMHTIPPQTLVRNSPEDNTVQQLSNAVIARERFMKDLISLAQSSPSDATILAGDLNATTRNRVYRIVRSLGFRDAWSVGGRFNGGTWPGPQFPLPSWLVRIDFIFHTEALMPVRAETLAEGYGSDHRGVFAVFSLRPN